MTAAVVLVFAAGVAAGWYMLLRESDTEPGRLRLASWWRVTLIVLIALVLSTDQLSDLGGGHGDSLSSAFVWLAGVALGGYLWNRRRPGRSPNTATDDQDSDPAPTPAPTPTPPQMAARTTGAAAIAEAAAKARPATSSEAEPAAGFPARSAAGFSAEPAAGFPAGATAGFPAGATAGFSAGAEGGVAARRAVVRWAWRLFRREWRQQLIVLELIAGAVAATILGAAVAVNTPPSANAGFGTANQLVTLQGGTPRLASDIAAIGAHFGGVDVIENQSLTTGLTQDITLRSQDPDGRYGRPMLSLVSGRYPAGPNETAISGTFASTFGLRVGDVWRGGGQALRIVGTVENPQNLLDDFALVAPGRIASPTGVTVLFDATPASLASFTFPPGATAIGPQSSTATASSLLVMAIAVVGLIFVGLLATASFSVLAQRRLRALGMLSSLGATDRHVRLVMVANGAVVGVAGTLAGAAIGLGGWLAYAPHLATSTDHSVSWSNLPWWLVTSTMLLAIVTAVVAAWRPAHAVTRVPVVTALAGRPAPTRGVHLSALPGALLLGLGLVLLVTSGGFGNGNNALEVLGGVAAVSAGLLLLTPITIALLGTAAHRAPIAIRIALRDLARYRARSAAALGASSFAILIAMFVVLIAAGRYANPVDYVGPNLSNSQLAVYSPDTEPGAAGPAAPAVTLSPAQQASRANAIATSLGSRDVLDLEVQNVSLFQQTPLHRPQGNSGRIYLATPDVLRHYGIDPSAIAPTTDLITSRAGLAGASGLRLIPDMGTAAEIGNPRIQTRVALPAGTTTPNLLITEQAARRLGLRTVRHVWLVQASQPLTAIQIATARHMALAAGLTIETRNGDPAASQISDDATLIGILLALGVLVMTVGLIRGEAAGEMRVLTATGAGGVTRRGITSATAGALALLGAVLGTAVAYLATAAFMWDELAQWLGNTPALDLFLVLVGLPAVAVAGGWLLAGRGSVRARPGVVR